MNDLHHKIEETFAALKPRLKEKPEVGIILGTGLGGLAREIKADYAVPYQEIPHFVHSTVESHAGQLHFGTLGGKRVMAMQGRFHYYEGYTMQEITYPVRVMKALGCRAMLVSNACGCVNPLYKPGDLMIMDDHVNLLGDNPLIGPNDDRLGPRFPDMSEPYSRRLIALAEQVALEIGVWVQKGTYVAVPGPNLETRAEYRMIRAIGGDVVGMSTVPEVIVANHCGLEAFGISIVTDEGFADCLKPASIEHILKTAAEAEPKMTKIMSGLIERL
ncbi:purine-nucleoside phosphorylase [bacterium]|nr:purine-nucleoside phosphorylase [bacterium]